MAKNRTYISYLRQRCLFSAFESSYEGYDQPNNRDEHHESSVVSE